MRQVQINLDETGGRILYMIAGCNGAGKTTAFRNRLSSQFRVPIFLNADDIARELCPDDVERVAVEAGRIMLQKIDEQLEKDESFCIETTLSTRHFGRLVKRAQEKGFKVALFFYWLESPELAVCRVAQRVRSGGHNIPTDVIRRRYERGIANLFSIYLPIVDYWHIDNNSGFLPAPIAEGGKEIYDMNTFLTLQSNGK
ncbi:MAG: zeta toxin family protein [Bacteroidales bacterium]|nr:zeta toxin family protein [Bacteroidales bacterium]